MYSPAVHHAGHVLTSRTSCWRCTHQPHIMLEMYSPAAHHAGHLQELRPCYRRSPNCRFCALVSWSPPWPGGSERSGGCQLAALPAYIWICYIHLACWACHCSGFTGYWPFHLVIFDHVKWNCIFKITPKVSDLWNVHLSCLYVARSADPR